MERVLAQVRRELRRDGAYLLPLRLFLGLGWLRTFAEKATEPGWRDGSELAAFLSSQVERGEIVFPLYRELVVELFLPNATLLGWLVMVGELLVGVAILLGLLTSLALLVATFMNLNFILAGEPTPSAFYVVIQVALLVGGVGAVLGLDARLDRIRSPLLVAKSAARSPDAPLRRRHYLALAAACAAGALYAGLHVSTLDPALSVEDPAMVLVVLLTVTALQVLISFLRQAPLAAPPVVRRPPDEIPSAPAPAPVPTPPARARSRRRRSARRRR